MPQAASAIRYAGFISYRHLPHDRYWAMEIMRRLEAFRTPSSLRKQGYPDRLGTIFRDEDEIPASGDLSDQIRQALHNSDLLIVICSQDTSASRWVRREIELFHEMGKGDKIIPVLISGTPEQAFPPELLRRKAERTLPDGTIETFWEAKEPLAADVRPVEGESPAKTEERAIFRIAAAALGCRFDDLAQREAHQRRARQRTTGALSAAFLAVVAAAGLWYWDSYIRLKTELYANYSERWGVPVGEGSIGESTAAHLNKVYRVTKRAGRVLELARLNGSGSLSSATETLYEGEPWTKDAARWTFDYREDGTLSAVKMFTGTGRSLRQLQYRFSEDKRHGVMLFERDLGEAESQAAGGMSLASVAGDQSGRRGSVGQHRLTFDGTGLVIERSFEPVGGGATIADATGAYGRTYRYSAAGLAISVRNLDSVSDTLIEKSGVAEVRRSYDPMGRLIDAEWRTKTGGLAQNDLHFARVVFERDGDGRISATRYEDEEGRPALRKDWGVARVTNVYDARGNAVENAYFGIDGQPALRKDLGFSRGTSVYDARGNNVEQAYFGTDGKPALRKDWGVARMTWVYDARGNSVEQAYFGTNGKPALHKDWGVARVTFVYDARGNAAEQAYFGIDGQPALRKDVGIARVTNAHDARGNAVENAYFGADGQPALRKDWGVARITSAYDARGNNVENAYFGTDGKPTLRKDLGVARLTSAYDARGNMVEQVYFGTDGKPALRKAVGLARIASAFDARGNNVENTYFGIDGKPALQKDLGAARVIWLYDERGNTIEQDFYGADGQLAENAIGLAHATSKWDGLGRMIEARYFDRNGKPVLRANRLLKTDLIADLFGERHDLVLSGALDKAALAAIGSGGFARIEQTFDARGHPTRRSFFGVNDEPVAGLDGFPEESVEYDALDRPVLFRPIAGSATVTPLEQIWTRLTYDIKGDVVQIDYVAPDGKIVNGKSGFASIAIELGEGVAGSKFIYKDAAGAVIREK
ncbi:MAG: TIR domain-containing protein [Rhodomicrobium sp.]